MQGHQAKVPLFLGMTHQEVSSVESPVAACDNLSSNEKPLAVLSFLKNASFRTSIKPSAATLRAGKSFPYGGLWGH